MWLPCRRGLGGTRSFPRLARNFFRWRKIRKNPRSPTRRRSVAAFARPTPSCAAALVPARRAVEHGQGSQWLVNFKMALGMAEYRSGHFAEADTALTAAMNDSIKWRYLST